MYIEGINKYIYIYIYIHEHIFRYIHIYLYANKNDFANPPTCNHMLHYVSTACSFTLNLHYLSICVVSFRFLVILPLF